VESASPLSNALIVFTAEIFDNCAKLSSMGKTFELVAAIPEAL
jgi:hypothetical protein